MQRALMDPQSLFVHYPVVKHRRSGAQSAAEARKPQVRRLRLKADAVEACATREDARAEAEAIDEDACEDETVEEIEIPAQVTPAEGSKQQVPSDVTSGAKADPYVAQATRRSVRLVVRSRQASQESQTQVMTPLHSSHDGAAIRLRVKLVAPEPDWQIGGYPNTFDLAAVRNVSRVSYGVPSESLQIGAAASVSQLPPVVYQPPVRPFGAQDPRPSWSSLCSPSMATTVTRIPIAALKEYIAIPAKRWQLAGQAAAAGVTLPVHALRTVAAEQGYAWCFHFHYEPAAASLSPMLCKTVQELQDTVASATVLLVVEARKSVAGTYEAKRAAGAADAKAPDDGSDDEQPEASVPDQDLSSAGCSVKTLRTVCVRTELIVTAEHWLRLSHGFRQAMQLTIRDAELRLLDSIKQVNSDMLAVAAPGSQYRTVLPLHLVSTRDAYTSNLLVRKTIFADKHVTRHDYFFRSSEAPNNFLRSGVTLRAVVKPLLAEEQEVDAVDSAAILAVPDYESSVEEEEEEEEIHIESPTVVIEQDPSVGIDKVGFAVGMSLFTDIFSHEQLTQLEQLCDSLHASSRQGTMRPETFHDTFCHGKLVRTKYFFNARYLWTKGQLASMDAKTAAGIRLDVNHAPRWLHALVEGPLIEAGILEPGFVNSFAINMYHDGSEGIAQHVDDIGRFDRPIVSLRLFSDARLSFGTQYGWSNSAFFMPLPRGGIAVLHKGGYAANCIKHCVRPMDMAGKSAVILLRRVHPHCLEQAADLQAARLSAHLNAMHLGPGAWHIESSTSSRELDQVPVTTDEMRSAVCAKVLDRLISSMEVSHKKAEKEAKTISRLVRGLIRKVEVAARQEAQITHACTAALNDVIEQVVRKHAPPRPISVFHPAAQPQQLVEEMRNRVLMIQQRALSMRMQCPMPNAVACRVCCLALSKTAQGTCEACLPIWLARQPVVIRLKPSQQQVCLGGSPIKIFLPKQQAEEQIRVVEEEEEEEEELCVTPRANLITQAAVSSAAGSVEEEEDLSVPDVPPAGSPIKVVVSTKKRPATDATVGQAAQVRRVQVG